MKSNSETLGDIIDFVKGEAAVVVRGRTKIEVKPFAAKDGYPWVILTILRSGETWVPSFEELYYILRGIARCEDSRYNRAFSAGSGKVYDFLKSAIYEDLTYEELALRHKLPAKSEIRFIPMKR